LLSGSLLEELALYARGGSISGFIEAALIRYVEELKRLERGRRDIEIINANAKRYSEEAEENLEFQAVL